MLKIKKRLIDSTNITLGTVAILIGMVGSVSALHILDNSSSKDTAPKPLSSRNSSTTDKPSSDSETAVETNTVNLAASSRTSSPAPQAKPDCDTDEQQSTSTTHASTTHDQPQAQATPETTAPAQPQKQQQPQSEQHSGITASVGVSLQPVLSLPLVGSLTGQESK